MATGGNLANPEAVAIDGSGFLLVTDVTTDAVIRNRPEHRRSVHLAYTLPQ